MAKTNQEKLAAAVALVAKLTAAINSEAILNNVAKGNEVVFTFGRGDKKRELTGTVVGIRDDEKLGRLVAISVTGDDEFDTQTYKVNVRDITENKSVEASEEAAVEGGDPLSND